MTISLDKNPTLTDQGLILEMSGDRDAANRIPEARVAFALPYLSSLAINLRVELRTAIEAHEGITAPLVPAGAFRNHMITAGLLPQNR